MSKQMKSTLHAAVEAVARAAIPLSFSPESFDPLVRELTNATVVAIGESSHGTHEFYKTRGMLTRRLIVEQGATAVFWEADWPDAVQVCGATCAKYGCGGKSGW
jgi:erythromycin esterase-like protein